MSVRDRLVPPGLTTKLVRLGKRHRRVRGETGYVMDEQTQSTIEDADSDCLGKESLTEDASILLLYGQELMWIHYHPRNE